MKSAGKTSWLKWQVVGNCQRQTTGIRQTKTEFWSIASHQLRTPLTVLKGYVELIEDGAYGKISRPLRKILGNLDSNNEHLIKLVDDF